MVTVSALDLWLPLALESWQQAILATLFTFLGWRLTSFLSSFPLPEPEHLAVAFHRRASFGNLSDTKTTLTDEEVALYHIADSDDRLMPAANEQERTSRTRAWRYVRCSEIFKCLHLNCSPTCLPSISSLG